jgi:hypothetical protein
MMNLRRIAVPLITLALSITACGGVSADQKAKIEKLQKDPAVQRVQAEFEAKHKECFHGLKTFSKEGFREYMGCLAPPKQRAEAKACFDKDLKKNGFPHTKGAVRLHLTWIANCVVKETK